MKHCRLAAYTIDSDGLITYFNEPAEILWGRKPKLHDTTNQYSGAFQLYTPDKSPIAHDQCWMAVPVKEGRSIEGKEILIGRPDGSIRSVLVHANPLRDASGHVVGGVNVLVDLTEQKAIQSMLERGERSIRELYEVTSSQERTFEQKIRALLDLGCQRFGLPVGTLTKQIGEYLELEFLHCPDDSWQEHFLVPICDSFCGQTLTRHEPLVFEHAGASDWKDFGPVSEARLGSVYRHPRHGWPPGVWLSVFLGIDNPMQANSRISDLDFLLLMARWIGSEIERKQAHQALQEANTRLKTLSQQLITVQETERRQLAHDLHDEIGQALTAVKINLQTLEQLGGLPGAPGLLPDSKQILDYMLKHVRELSLDLHPSMLDDLGLAATVRWFAHRQAERAGWTLDIHIGPELPPLSPEQATACFRMIQESLTNIMRHAQAQDVKLELRANVDNFEVFISDNGNGFDPESIKKTVGRRRKFRSSEHGGAGSVFEGSIEHYVPTRERHPDPSSNSNSKRKMSLGLLLEFSIQKRFQGMVHLTPDGQSEGPLFRFRSLR